MFDLHQLTHRGMVITDIVLAIQRYINLVVQLVQIARYIFDIKASQQYFEQ